MTYTKSQLEALSQWLEKTLKLFDDSYFYWMTAKPQRATDFRAGLVKDLTTYRKALAEAEEEDEPYVPSEAYLNALRSFGLTDEDCVEELRSARESDFELLLADEKRKAYDLGDSQGYSKGYNTGYDWGKKDGKAEGKAEGYDEGRSEAQSYSQYIQANAHRVREGWQPVCFDEFMECEFLVENEP